MKAFAERLKGTATEANRISRGNEGFWEMIFRFILIRLCELGEARKKKGGVDYV